MTISSRTMSATIQPGEDRRFDLANVRQIAGISVTAPLEIRLNDSADRSVFDETTEINSTVPLVRMFLFNPGAFAVTVRLNLSTEQRLYSRRAVGRLAVTRPSQIGLWQAVNVGNAATLLVPVNSGRDSVTISAGDSELWWGGNDQVQANVGPALLPGQAATIQTTGAIYAVRVGGAGDAHYLEALI